MNEEKLTQQIARLKKAKKAVLLVHNYQRGEIQEIADFLGDSLELARKSAQITADILVFCGVKFMAETAKILSPHKKVLLPRLEAGCPMAEMVDVQGLRQLKKQHPRALVVTYVNSTAEVKAESDVCCTSANAVNVVQNVESDEIIFTPDKNLAAYVQRHTDKKIIPWDGYCYVHNRFSKEEIVRAKQLHPDALLMVHPECSPEVIDEADEVLSTGGMVRFARKTTVDKILVGTEEGMLYRLKKENPDITFLSAGSAKMCRGMKITQLEDVHNSLHEEQFSIDVPVTTQEKARKAIERMLAYV